MPIPPTICETCGGDLRRLATTAGWACWCQKCGRPYQGEYDPPPPATPKPRPPPHNAVPPAERERREKLRAMLGHQRYDAARVGARAEVVSAARYHQAGRSLTMPANRKTMPRRAPEPLVWTGDTARYAGATVRVHYTHNWPLVYHADAEWRNGGHVYQLLIGKYRTARAARRGCERALRRLADALFEDSLRRWKAGDNLITRAARRNRKDPRHAAN